MAADNTYWQSRRVIIMLIATGNEDEVTRVKEQNLEKRTVLAKDHQDTILGYQSVINEKRIELEYELTEEVLKAQKKMTSEITKELNKRVKAAEKAIKAATKIQKELISILTMM